MAESIHRLEGWQTRGVGEVPRAFKTPDEVITYRFEVRDQDGQPAPLSGAPVWTPDDTLTILQEENAILQEENAGASFSAQVTGLGRARIDLALATGDTYQVSVEFVSRE